MTTVNLAVNGKAISVSVEDRTLLVHFLRDHLNLTGTHEGTIVAGKPAIVFGHCWYDAGASLSAKLLVGF